MGFHLYTVFSQNPLAFYLFLFWVCHLSYSLDVFKILDCTLCNRDALANCFTTFFIFLTIGYVLRLLLKPLFFDSLCCSCKLCSSGAPLAPFFLIFSPLSLCVYVYIQSSTHYVFLFFVVFLVLPPLLKSASAFYFTSSIRRTRPAAHWCCDTLGLEPAEKYAANPLGPFLMCLLIYH